MVMPGGHDLEAGVIASPLPDKWVLRFSVDFLIVLEYNFTVAVSGTAVIPQRQEVRQEDGKGNR